MDKIILMVSIILEGFGWYFIFNGTSWYHYLVGSLVVLGNAWVIATAILDGKD